MAKQKGKNQALPKKRTVEQYEHKGKQRVNNPPVGLVTPETDPDVKAGQPKKKYQYDPHLDPQLVWAGKAEHTSFEVPTVSLHVHERIDPRTIIEAVRKKNGNNYEQMSLFSAKDENPPLREAIDFYKHRHNWSNRLIAGDSLLVMNSLLEKEGLGGQVQMIYIDPPYGIKYGSNFQPFVNKRDVKDGKDEDLTAEPEMIKAFRDTWELGIHSYLTYLRDRLLLARELLSESGSIFVQISDENVHHVRELMDEVFGAGNFCAIISFTKAAGGLRAATRVGVTLDYIVWYASDVTKVKYRPLYEKKDDPVEAGFTMVEEPDGSRRPMTAQEKSGRVALPKGARTYMTVLMTKPGPGSKFVVQYKGRKYDSGNRWWGTTPEGIENVIKANRVVATENSIRFVTYFEDFPYRALTNLWSGFGGAADPIYVVQTNKEIVQRCLLMTTDPGDLVFDPTCGSGTTAYVAEQWGRRWITCDTSRVAITLAKQRLMTAVFDYYELAHPEEGVGSGFIYKTVPHITLKSIANNEPPAQETLYDQPYVDNKRTRVTGPFTVEAVPAPVVKPLDALTPAPPPVAGEGSADATIARSGETLRQREWRDELLKSGIRGKNGQYILFSRVEPLSGTRWLHAEAETKPNERGAMTVKEAKVKYGPHPAPLLGGEGVMRVVISFGPEHGPLEPRQVELAWEEARSLAPRPTLLVFAAFQFDPEAAKDIDELPPEKAGMTLLKVQMNADLLTDDLKKKRTSSESFWLIGQPDVRVVSEEWLVDSNERRIARYGDIAKLSGSDSLAKINGLDKADLLLYAILSERRDLWTDLTDPKGSRLDPGEYRGGSGEKQHRGVRTILGDSEGLTRRIADALTTLKRSEFSRGGKVKDLVGSMRRNKQVAEWLAQIPLHSPLTTRHFHTVHVLGFDYYNTRTGTIESGGNEKIAMWLLDTDYDGRSLFPRQVFFPMAGENEGWSRLARNLKAEIDEELLEQYRGTVSLPFEPGKHKRIAVKIVDDRGIESLKVMEVQ